ncbi:hypothetical protein Avbf_08854, partial [Armadillidium vulgare]
PSHFQPFLKAVLQHTVLFSYLRTKIQNQKYLKKERKRTKSFKKKENYPKSSSSRKRTQKVQNCIAVDILNVTLMVTI